MSTAAKEKVLGKYKLLSPDFKPPPHPPPLRPSRLVKSLAGVDGGDFLIPRRRNDAGWRFIFPSLQSASGTYNVWQLLRVATIACGNYWDQFWSFEENFCESSAHLAGGAREKCTSPTVPARRTKAFFLFFCQLTCTCLTLRLCFDGDSWVVRILEMIRFQVKDFHIVKIPL